MFLQIQASHEDFHWIKMASEVLSGPVAPPQLIPSTQRNIVWSSHKNYFSWVIWWNPREKPFLSSVVFYICKCSSVFWKLSLTSFCSWLPQNFQRQSKPLEKWWSCTPGCMWGWGQRGGCWLCLTVNARKENPFQGQILVILSATEVL